MRQPFGLLYLAVGVLALVAVLHSVTRCKPGVGGAVSTGAGVAEIVCALVLDEKGTEREICDTGVKLAELLARLLAQNSAAPAPMASGAASSAAPSASSLPVASAPVERKPVRILNLYVKRSQ